MPLTVCILAGPEFVALAGHRLIVDKALYGRRTSGQRWHERFAECMRAEGYVPCKAEPDIWMRPNGDVYEYVAIHVDDLAFAVIDPEAFAKVLQDKYNFKLKGTGDLSFHLGANFTRDEDGTLCMRPTKYITERMVKAYEKMFGEKPKQTVLSPLEHGDHPELDYSELLDENGINQYQSLIGSLQWVLALGRYDIGCAVMSLSSYRVAPRRGHLERLNRICGYLVKIQYFGIRFRTHEPDFSNLKSVEQDWFSVYGNVCKALPVDAP